MTGRTAVLIAGIAAFAASSVGCTCCRHRALYEALASADAADLPATRRNEVFTFIVGGDDPFDRGPDRLATGLNELGFAKVYTGNRFLTDRFAREARRVVAENPDARIAVVGRRAGAVRAAELVARLADDGIVVDSFVMIDPDELPSIEYTVKGVQAKVYYPSEDGLEAAPVSSLLNGVTRRVRVEGASRPVLPLVDDPAPTPEVQVSATNSR